MSQIKILELVSGYDRSKNPKTKQYRQITFEEAKLLQSGNRIEILCNDGKVRDARINGKPQTWKTRPNDLRIPCKYGMYEYFDITYKNGLRTFGYTVAIVIPV